MRLLRGHPERRASSAPLPFLRAGSLIAFAVMSTAVMFPGESAAAGPSAFSFGAAGDFGYSAAAQATFLSAGGAGLDFFLAMGDTTYDETSESAWCSAFKSHVPHVLVEAGNHDTGENNGADLGALLASCPYELAEPMTGRYGREWFFDYPAGAPLARLVLSGCGTSFNVDNQTTWACAAGNPHYQFVSDAIDGARAAGIPWVIVGMHKNCLSAGSKSCEIGSAFLNLLLDKKVDLILQGHDHLYERSKQLACATPNVYRPECIKDDGSDGRYAKGNGSVLMVLGMGGRSPYDFNTSDAEAGYFATGFATTYGLAKFTVNESAVGVEFLRSAGGDDRDSFVIASPGAPPAPQPPPPSATNATTPLADSLWFVVPAVGVTVATVVALARRGKRRGR